MSEEEFTYDGYLVFKPAISVTQSFNKSELKDLSPTDLPKFEQGSPHNRGIGFERKDLSKYQMPRFVEDIYYSNVENAEYFKFKSENYDPKEVFIHDEIREGYVRNIDTADLFLFPSGVLQFRGKKRSIKKSINHIERENEDIIVDPLEIISDDLFELLKKPESLLNGSPISLKRIRSVSFAGRDELSNINMSVGGINSDVRDHIDYADVYHPESIEAEFRFRDIEVSVEIERSRIYVRTSDGDLDQKSDLNRMIYSVALVNILTETLFKNYLE
jgi:hypothetical protein